MSLHRHVRTFSLGYPSYMRAPWSPAMFSGRYARKCNRFTVPSGRFDYAAIGTVSNVASRLCDEAKPGQILVSPRVLTKVENAVTVEPVGEFELKWIRRPLVAFNVVAASPSKVCNG
jgi:hypothetical protein